MTATLNSVTLIGGMTGSGKTNLLATLAIHCWRKHKKVTRLCSTDGGGYGVLVDALIKRGIVHVWRPRTRVGAGGEGLIEETLALMAKGYWPAEWDPETGESPVGVEMVPPVQTHYRMFCSCGNQVRETTAQSALKPLQCSKCKKTVKLADARIERELKKQKDFEKVGAQCFDGVTSATDWLMMALAERTGRQELAGEKAAIGRIVSGNMAFGGNNRSHYMFAQGQAEKWMLDSTAIPGLLYPPVWTCLEQKGEDEKGFGFWGPSLAGQAKLAKAPQWVGNFIGCRQVTNDKGENQWRLYLRRYKDDDGLEHRYKIRDMPGSMPEYLADEWGSDQKSGLAFQGFNLGVFFDLLEEQAYSEADKYINDMVEAPPGVPTGILEAIKKQQKEEQEAKQEEEVKEVLSSKVTKRKTEKAAPVEGSKRKKAPPVKW